MFEQAVQFSAAMRQAGRHVGGALAPALCECRRCRTARMIASPLLGICADCGAELVLLGSPGPRNAGARKPLTRAA